MLIKGTKIRRRGWEDDDYIQYVRGKDVIQLHARWTAYPYDGEEITKDVLYGLLAWDDWEIFDEEGRH